MAEACDDQCFRRITVDELFNSIGGASLNNNGYNQVNHSWVLSNIGHLRLISTINFFLYLTIYV